MLKRRGPINWKQDPAVTGDKPAHPRRHEREDEVPPSLLPKYEAAFVPGHMFLVQQDLRQQQLPPTVTPPPWPVLEQVRRHWDPRAETAALVPAGALAMYAGAIRVEEEGRQGTLRVIRHTFIVADGRYIVPNLNWVSPLSS